MFIPGQISARHHRGDAVCHALPPCFPSSGPKILGNATTELFNGMIAKLTGTGGIDFDGHRPASCSSCWHHISGQQPLLSYIQGWIMTGVSTQDQLRNAAGISAEKINRMPLAYFDRVPNGEVLSRITNDVDTVTPDTQPEHYADRHQRRRMLIGVLVMMLTISPLMTLVALCILPREPAHRQQCGKAQPALLPDQQQDYLGHAQRPCGGDVWRPSGGNGLQPVRKRASRRSTKSTITCITRPGKASFSPA